jgi:hypothetical protein
MGYLNCELFHFNPNATSVLSTFVMLYECWLRIVPDTSLLWYYYSPVRYSKVVYGGIGLSLRRPITSSFNVPQLKQCGTDFVIPKLLAKANVLGSKRFNSSSAFTFASALYISLKKLLAIFSISDLFLVS